MEYIKCDKMFRKTQQRFSSHENAFTQERTFWSLICEVLACYTEGLTKDEIIKTIGYCSSQCQVWTSLKYWGYVERVPKTWKLRLTNRGFEHLKEVFKSNGFDLNTQKELDKTLLFKEQFEQGRIKNMKTDF